MSHHRRLIASLLLVGLLLLTVGSAAAQGGSGKDRPKNKPAKARVTWSQARVEQTVAPGQTVEVTVTLMSSADLQNVTLRVPGGLRRVLKVEPSSFASLKAGVATPVKLTISMPAQKGHTQGGVIQVRAGKRNLPAALKVLVTVPGSTDTEKGD